MDGQGANGTGSPDQEVLPAGVDAQAVSQRAHEVEREIVRGCRAIRTAGMFLAGKLHEFTEGRMWEPLGYETQEEWLAGPEIELGKSQVSKLVRVYRCLVLERGVQTSALEGVSPDKLDVALPAIKSGKVPWQDAVADARTLGYRDMRERYKAGKDPNAALDADEEPEKVKCEHCGSWVAPARLES